MGDVSQCDGVYADYCVIEQRLLFLSFQAGLDPVTAFPPIRVFGTVGFIVAMWAVSLLHLELSSLQLYIASGASLLLSAYALTLPKIPVAEKKRLHRLPASWAWMPSCCLKIHAWLSFSSSP